MTAFKEKLKRQKAAQVTNTQKGIKVQINTPTRTDLLDADSKQMNTWWRTQ